MDRDSGDEAPGVLPDAPTTFDALVEQTAGPQWWRKVFHAFNAVAVAAVIAVWDLSRGVSVLALSAALFTALAVDAVRLTNPRVNELFFRAFGKLVSPREAQGVASSTWYVVGMLLVVALFPQEVAVSAILVLGLCDPAAAFVGRRFGRRPLLGGTVEGTLAFVLVATAVLAARHPWPAALAAAVAAALAERRSWPLDDNLAVPLVCAAVIQAGAWIG
jgi:dolichol kinase